MCPLTLYRPTSLGLATYPRAFLFPPFEYILVSSRFSVSNPLVRPFLPPSQVPGLIPANLPTYPTPIDPPPPPKPPFKGLKFTRLHKLPLCLPYSFVLPFFPKAKRPPPGDRARKNPRLGGKKQFFTCHFYCMFIYLVPVFFFSLLRSAPRVGAPVPVDVRS